MEHLFPRRFGKDICQGGPNRIPEWMGVLGSRNGRYQPAQWRPHHGL
eukprot:gene30452-37671_t